MDVKIIKRVSTWGKILGITTVISGIFNAIIGLIFFIFGAVPGIISIYLGYQIYKTGRAAGEYLTFENEDSILALLESYSKYLIVSGVLMLISLVIALLVMFIGGTAVFTLFGLLK